MLYLFFIAIQLSLSTDLIISSNDQKMEHSISRFSQIVITSASPQANHLRIPLFLSFLCSVMLSLPLITGFSLTGLKMLFWYGLHWKNCQISFYSIKKLALKMGVGLPTLDPSMFALSWVRLSTSLYDREKVNSQTVQGKDTLHLRAAQARPVVHSLSVQL